MQQQHQPVNPTQQPQLSILQQTLSEIQDRVNFFATNSISAQNYLLQNQQQQSTNIRSISQILTSLKYYSICQTPLNLNLTQIYASQDRKSQYNWALHPPSQGQDSINQQQSFQPSFKWLSSALIDFSLLELDHIQPRKVQRGKVSDAWKGITEIILVNVKQKIYLKQEIKQIQNVIKDKFQKYTWIKFKRAKQIYYKGKPSVILKFGDENSATFVHFNLLSWKSNRQEFGQDCQVFRVVKNDLRQTSKLKNWVILLFRRLPISMTKQSLHNIISNHQVTIKWIDELVQIAGYKYGIYKVSYLDQALRACLNFNNRRIRDARINIHPKSSKNWKSQQEQDQQIIFEAERMS